MKTFAKWSIALACGIMVYLLTTILFMPMSFNVNGMSMFPALCHNDVVLTYGKSFATEMDIERNDVVILDMGNDHYVKRIIGMPGERIEIVAGIVIIDRKLIKTPGLLNNETSGLIQITLGPDEYYVMGDNRDVSRDSRTFGPVVRKQIIGKVFFKWRNPTRI